MTEPNPRREPPAIGYTLDQIWSWYGDRMQRVAKTLLDQEEDMARVVAHVMERAALDLARADELPAPGPLGAWLMRLVRQTCAAPPPRTGPAPLPLAATEVPVTRRTRLYYWAREQRRRTTTALPFNGEAARRARGRLGLVPGAALLFRRLRARWAETVEQGRAVLERAAQAAHGVAGASTFSIAAASSGLGEAAAIVVAAVTFAVAAPQAAGAAGGTPARPPLDPRAGLAHTERPADRPVALDPTPTAVPPPATPAAWPPPAHESSPGIAAPPPAIAEPPVATPTPQITAPDEPTQPRVDERRYEGGQSTHYVIHGPGPITSGTDLDGNGKEDVQIGRSWVGVECGPPDERPPVWQQTCPVLEAHGEEFAE